jgi:hypothetical protein
MAMLPATLDMGPCEWGVVIAPVGTARPSYWPASRLTIGATSSTAAALTLM